MKKFRAFRRRAHFVGGVGHGGTRRNPSRWVPLCLVLPCKNHENWCGTCPEPVAEPCLDQGVSQSHPHHRELRRDASRPRASATRARRAVESHHVRGLDTVRHRAHVAQLVLRAAATTSPTSRRVRHWHHTSPELRIWFRVQRAPIQERSERGRTGALRLPLRQSRHDQSVQ